MVYWADPDDAMAVLGHVAHDRAGVLDPGPGAGALRRRLRPRLSGDRLLLAFGYWKLACILQGVYARYVAGAGAGDQGSVDAFPAQVGRLAEMAAEALETAP